MTRSTKGATATSAGALAVVATALIALVGCGGSNSSATDAQEPTSSGGEVAISKVELIKKGDAICRRTDQIQRSGLATYQKNYPNKLTGKANSEKFLKEVAFPPIASEIAGLNALGAPPEGGAEVGAIITGLKQALQEAESKPSLMLAVGEGPFAGPDKLAGEYGFKDCAKAL